MSTEPEDRPSAAGETSGLVEFLDTNTVVRYLVRDDAGMAKRAAALIESDRSLRISVLILAEIGFVLTRVYRIDREQVVDTLINLLNRENIETHEVEVDLAIQALRLCRPSGRVNYADALLWAVARAAAPASGGNPSRVWSFDERFPADGIELRQP
jgi:predicted nucleic-acid-binding protein